MRVFKTRDFARFARRERIDDLILREAIARAERQLIDADLGGGIIKQRVPRHGQGRSGGFRTLIAYRQGNIAVFLHGFAKADQDNLDVHELRALKAASRSIFALDSAAIAKALRNGIWMEVGHNDQEVQERRHSIGPSGDDGPCGDR